MIDEILATLGLELNYDQLTVDEKETLNNWVNALQSNALTLEKVREYIVAMRDSVATALVDEPDFSFNFIFKIPNEKQRLLKARLKNYILLEAFLSTPEKAKRELERALTGIASKKTIT